MKGIPAVLELVGIDPSRFDELDVARCVARLGGSMIGRQIVFSDTSQLDAALDELFARFGAQAFSCGDSVNAPSSLEPEHRLEVSHA
ncbi:hypothetical protein Mal15_15770 [Stieleria maiorica]|uniref:Uncharacterized protein n=1 Tax=Stieleria maiorica TaxID=2795974 RepID=A0A5B9MEC0_9BACT|nr:hypothetical protein [Stieleria maiorica]QEF97537.1 hypothetical protein Mal15_15770 [Stieleria maiorica]